MILKKRGKNPLIFYVKYRILKFTILFSSLALLSVLSFNSCLSERYRTVLVHDLFYLYFV